MVTGGFPATVSFPSGANMGSAAEYEEALSDLEDDPAPVVLPASAGVPNAESLKAVLAKLELEKQAREATETAKAELQYSFTRLKSFTQEALRQRDEANRNREEAQKVKEELARQLSEAIEQRDEFALQRDDALKSKEELSRLKDEASKVRDSSRSEIEVAARLLVAGAEKITARASSIKNFPGSLARSSSHTGVAAIAFGYTKRAEEIVEELVRHNELAAKKVSELRHEMDQRNYQIAIEVSELEASIQRLKDELSKKSLELERSQRLTLEKDGRLSEIEQEVSNKKAETEKATEMLANRARAAEDKIGKMKASIAELSHLIIKTRETITTLDDSLSTSQRHPPNKLSSLSMCNEPEAGLQDCISRLKEAFELCSNLGVTWREHRQLREKEVNDLEGAVTRLMIEKKEIINFLRSALANKQVGTESVSISGVDGDCHIDTAREISETKDKPVGPSIDSSKLTSKSSPNDELTTGEAVSMASALDLGVRQLRRELFELQQCLAAARGELEWLRVTSDRQTRELSEKATKICELEEKEALAEENIKGLRADLAIAEEEIVRWKQAATKEAEAGSTVLEEMERCQEEIIVLKEQTEQLSQSLKESNSKLQTKEEMAKAAIAAQNAAEWSLRIADERAVELRQRVEEMTRQFEALEGRVDGGLTMGLFDMCWPYQWFRSRTPYLQRDTAARAGAEVEELLEPLM